MTIITEFDGIAGFNEILAKNTGIVILKLGATWCGPCKQIAPLVHGLMHQITSVYGDKVVCCDIDVDENFELYAFLKNKKMIKFIPSILKLKLIKKVKINAVENVIITCFKINFVFDSL